MTDGARLVGHLLAPLLAGVSVQALLEPPSRSWHQSLRKAPERPPALAFPLVWAYSYLAMGYAAHVLERRNASGGGDVAFGTGTGVQVAHFVVLQSWQFVFMSRRDIRGGLVVLILLDCLVPPMLACWYRVSPLVACLMLPYLAWLLLLTYLNWYMVEHNTRWGYSNKDDIVRLYNTPRDSDDDGGDDEEEDVDGREGMLLGDVGVGAPIASGSDLTCAMRRRPPRSRDEAVIPGS